VGALISNLLLPAATNSIDDGLAVTLCTALGNGAAGMAGTVVVQEGSEAIYPTNDTSASEWEQVIISGTFIGSIVTNSVATALSKSLCKGLIKGWTTASIVTADGLSTAPWIAASRMS
jgi:hypothetical protein